MSYANPSKLERAEAVVNKTRPFDEGSVELKALSLCGDEKDLVKCVYLKIGGALTEEVEEAKERSKKLPAGTLSSKREGKEVETLPKPAGKSK
jgi:hypothetical protein